MTAIAGRSGGTIKVGWTVERNPPVGAGLNVVRQPPLLLHIPLRGQRKIVVSPFGKIALLIPAAVHKGNIIQRETADRIRMSEVSKNSFGVDFGIANHVRHASLLPTVVELRV